MWDYKQKWAKTDSTELRNTVLGYKKGSKSKKIFSEFENMKSQLSNTLIDVLLRDFFIEIELFEVSESSAP